MGNIFGNDELLVLRAATVATDEEVRRTQTKDN
jgi:hypothetical protein